MVDCPVLRELFDLDNEPDVLSQLLNVDTLILPQHLELLGFRPIRVQVLHRDEGHEVELAHVQHRGVGRHLIGFDLPVNEILRGAVHLDQLSDQVRD